jgi:uncharacterized protein (TIGR03435 family)
MTFDQRELKHLVDRHLPAPSHMEFVATRDRVLDELRAVPPHLLKPRLADAPLAPSEPGERVEGPAVSWLGTAAPLAAALRTAVPLAAAAAIFATVATVSLQRGDWLATVHAADGSTYTLKPNEVLRASAGGGAMLTLRDGSSVEMRAASELSVDRAADGLDIRLRDGDIIVQAAKPRDGHLYVHTMDMTVALSAVAHRAKVDVAGTVFLVNAGADGSRVAVIEGEVRVREGAEETRLLPGEEVATSLTIARRPLTKDITWSRNASSHLAILESFKKGVAQTAGALAPLARQADAAAAQTAGAQAAAQTPGAQAVAPEFEEASIRECDPDNLPPSQIGARGGGANSVMATPGRFYALCVTPVALIRTSFGYRGIELEALLPDGLPRRGGRAPIRGQFGVVGSIGAGDGGRVRGGPDWIRKDRFTIEAVASGTPDAATMGGPMLRALFARRFKLKTHEETEQTLAYDLVVAPGGLTIKPVGSGACDVPVGQPGAVLLNGIPRGMERSFADVRRGQKPTCGVWGGVNGPNWVSVAGEATLAQLTQHVRERLVGIGVTDKTGITDKFNWDLEYVVDGNAANAPEIRPAGSDASGVARAPTIFDALQQQLGLRLEPVQVPRTYLVIDAIERPEPN